MGVGSWEMEPGSLQSSIYHLRSSIFHLLSSSPICYLLSPIFYRVPPQRSAVRGRKPDHVNRHGLLVGCGQSEEVTQLCANSPSPFQSHLTAAVEEQIRFDGVHDQFWSKVQPESNASSSAFFSGVKYFNRLPRGNGSLASAFTSVRVRVPSPLFA